ncbi:MAG: hypothetical protein R3264_15430, partial [Anaerolineae bacterium]|nr:hypothetical protein [Anaerolineae bacterium]
MTQHNREIDAMALTQKNPWLRSQTQLIVTLLFGQAFFLGATTALLYIASNTLFLVDFDPEFLPYVYIATGIVVSILFFGLTALQRHWSQVRLIAILLILEGLVFLLTRLALTLPNARWVSIFLMILFPLTVQLMVIILGGQVGRLLDVRETKRLYPIIFSGATIGFIITSLGSPFLVTLLTNVANLLVVAGVAVMLALVIFLATVRQFSDKFQFQVEPVNPNRPARSLGQLLKRRYTLNLFSYQMLSAIGSQLVIYIFLVQADARFTDEVTLARFFGNFGGIRNVF